MLIMYRSTECCKAAFTACKLIKVRLAKFSNSIKIKYTCMCFIFEEFIEKIIPPEIIRFHAKPSCIVKI